MADPAAEAPRRSQPDPVCATCGAVPGPEEVDVARLTWTRTVEAGRETWTCVECSRRHLRSIEGKLDTAWW